MPLLPVMPKPSETALVEWTSDHVDDEMLREIAAAERGQGEEDALRVLIEARERRAFVEEKYIPTIMEQLQRAGNHAKSRRMSERDHIVKLHAAATLLHLWHRETSSPIDHHLIMGHMIESGIAAGAHANLACRTYVAWLAEHHPQTLEYARSFHALGVLLLQLASDESIDFRKQLASLDELFWDEVEEFWRNTTDMPLPLSSEAGELHGTGDVRDAVKSGDYLWVLCLADLAGGYGHEHLHVWRRVVRAIAANQSDRMVAEIVELDRRLNPPTWRVPDPLA